MNPNVISNDVHVESELDQSLVRFEADRIAWRRVFEDDHTALIKEQAAI